VGGTEANHTFTFIDGTVTLDGVVKELASDVPSFDSTLNTGATPETTVSQQSDWTYTAYDTTYSMTGPLFYAFSADMTYAGANGVGTTILDGIQYSKIVYTYNVAPYNVAVVPSTGGTTSTYSIDGFSGTATYLLVKSAGGVVFRVLGGLSSGSLTASNYLTRFKVLDTSNNTGVSTGYCKDQTTAATAFGDNLFTEYDNTEYQKLLTGNGWNSTGGVLPSGAAACYDNSYTKARRSGRRSTASEICVNNGFNVKDAQTACVGVMFGAGTDGILDACISDWCAFGGSGLILEQYFVEARIDAQIDSQLIVSSYGVAAPVEVTQVSQTIIFALPNVTITSFNLNTETAIARRSALELGYGISINITVDVNGKWMFKTGCDVEVQANLDARRDGDGELSLEFITVIAEAALAAAITSGVTEAASFAVNVNLAIDSDPIAFASVATVSASDISSISTATAITVTLAGGTVSPTTAPVGSSDSELDTYIIVLIVLGSTLCVALVVIIVVKTYLGKNDEHKQDFLDESAAAEQAAGTTVPMEPITKVNTGVDYSGRPDTQI